MAMPANYKWPETVGPKWLNKTMPWIEEFWHTRRRFPSDSELVEQFRFTEHQLLKFKNAKIVYNALERRGIRQPDRHHLSPQQIAAITLLTNFSDSRSVEAKMAAIDVTAEQLNGWYRDPEFQNQLQVRSDESMDFFSAEATASLQRQIKKGNFQAIKFYFEITGRAQTPELLNLQQTVIRLVEVVQKHVKDPATLQAIANDLQLSQAALNPANPGVHK